MAGNAGNGVTQQAATTQPATQPAADQDAIDAFVHPVVTQLNAMAMRSPNPPIAEIEAMVRGHIEDYDAMMRAINRLWGNQTAAIISIRVPHFSAASMASITGGGAPAGPRRPETPPGLAGLGTQPAPARGGDGGGPDVDVDRDPITGEADVSASVGPVTGHVTTQPAPTADHPNGPQLTGASAEVAGDVGANTHASVSGGAQLDAQGHATGVGDASVTTRVTPNLAVGANAHVEGDGTAPVRVRGGASVRLRLTDTVSLQAAGAIDNNGVLNQQIAIEILTSPSPNVPISDDSKRRLRIFLQAQESTAIGANPNATGAGAQAGVLFNF